MNKGFKLFNEIYIFVKKKEIIFVNNVFYFKINNDINLRRYINIKYEFYVKLYGKIIYISKIKFDFF